jgi:hypothetical protein
MSYDFEIWSQKELNLTDLSLDIGWKILEVISDCYNTRRKNKNVVDQGR